MPPIESIASDLPMAVRVGVGAVGALLLLFGARLYNVAIFGSAFVAGALGMATLCHALAETVPALGQNGTVVVCSLVGGAVFSAFARAAHKLVLTLAGGIVGLLSGFVLVAEVVSLPVWSPAVTMLLGALAMPFLYRQMLKVITPLFGAVAMVWALNQADSLRWLVGLWLVGAIVQLVGPVDSGSSSEEDDEE